MYIHLQKFGNICDFFAFCKKLNISVKKNNRELCVLNYFQPCVLKCRDRIKERILKLHQNFCIFYF